MFESIEDFHRRMDYSDLEVGPGSVLVLKGCGPRGYPGMPGVGNMRLPRKLLAQGITDMVRIGYARMSGTAYGTIVLHVAPETAVGGPLALVSQGDEISLDVPRRTLTLKIPDAELALRQAAWSPPPAAYDRGYYRLYIDHVLQADPGTDFDFLVGGSGDRVMRESH